MLRAISFVLHCLLASVPLASALRQVTHDSSFHPDYILRITGEIISVACRTRTSAVVNGEFFPSDTNIGPFHDLVLTLLSSTVSRNRTWANCLSKRKPNDLGQGIQ
jgi:hypothetical protein